MDTLHSHFNEDLTLRRSLFLTPPPTPPRIRGGEQSDSCWRPPLNSREGGERSERGGGQTDTLRKVSYQVKAYVKMLSLRFLQFAGDKPQPKNDAIKHRQRII